MLPSAKKYLSDGGMAADVAAYTTIGCFLGGVVGIQFVSRILHSYIPSHVVDCDHSHDEDDGADDEQVYTYYAGTHDARWHSVSPIVQQRSITEQRPTYPAHAGHDPSSGIIIETHLHHLLHGWPRI